MKAFKYTAINTMGRTVRGTLSAENELDLEVRLKQTGFDLVDSRAARERRRGLVKSVKIKDLIMMCMHLEQLDKAGVPLHESLSDLRDTTDSVRLRDVLTTVYESLKSGKILSVALAEHPRIFNHVFIGLISASERTGKLYEAFHHLGAHMKWTNDMRRKVKKAIKYPIVLLIVMTGVISTLMIFVVPKLITFITSQGFAIPIHTRALIATSEAFQNYWFIILPTPVVFTITLITAYRKSERFAYKFDNLLLKAPVSGPVVRKIEMARFSHFFSVMFNSGIDVLESLKTAQDVVQNRVLKETIGRVREQVMEGSSLTAALKSSDQFPSLVVRMFKVGEDSGNMHDALENITFFYDREVNDAIDALIGMIQPALTVVMGLLIFWVIAAVFGPLYESMSKMNI